MNNKIIGLTMLVFGTAIGSFLTWLYLEQKYEQIMQDDIASVKAALSKKSTVSEKQEEIHKAVADAKMKPDISEYASMLHEQGYTNYSHFAQEKNDKPSKEDDDSMADDKPYTISPDDFAEFDDYEKISLTLYADHILADDSDEIVDDIDRIVGTDSLLTFGEYEEDSVFVRNDKLKSDYEILLDHRKYSDIVKEKPRGI